MGHFKVNIKKHTYTSIVSTVKALSLFIPMFTILIKLYDGNKLDYLVFHLNNYSCIMILIYQFVFK